MGFEDGFGKFGDESLAACGTCLGSSKPSRVCPEIEGQFISAGQELPKLQKLPQTQPNNTGPFDPMLIKIPMCKVEQHRDCGDGLVNEVLARAT